MEQPSKERPRPWIYVRSPCCPKIKPTDVREYLSHRKTYPRHVYDDGFIEPKTEIDKKMRELDEQTALEGDLVGKWLIFVERPKVDEAWEKISKAVIGGTLGISGKVSTLAQGRYRHMICVCTIVDSLGHPFINLGSFTPSPAESRRYCALSLLADWRFEGPTEELAERTAGQASAERRLCIATRFSVLCELELDRLLISLSFFRDPRNRLHKHRKPCAAQAKL